MGVYLYKYVEMIFIDIKSMVDSPGSELSLCNTVGDRPGGAHVNPGGGAARDILTTHPIGSVLLLAPLPRLHKS